MAADHRANRSPVNRLVIYRPKQGKESGLEAILRKHGPTLRDTGLLTNEPVRLWRVTDLGKDGSPSYFMETFQWRDEKAADTTHQIPEVMAVWETMGAYIEEMTLTTLEPI